MFIDGNATKTTCAFGGAESKLYSHSGYLLSATLALPNSLRQFVTHTLILIARLGEANRSLSIGKHARRNRLQRFVNKLVQTELAR